MWSYIHKEYMFICICTVDGYLGQYLFYPKAIIPDHTKSRSTGQVFLYGFLKSKDWKAATSIILLSPDGCTVCQALRDVNWLCDIYRGGVEGYKYNCPGI